MIYMLDSNICIYIMKERPEQVVKKFQTLHAGDIAVSSVILSEMAFGAYNSQHCEKSLSLLKSFMVPISVLPYTEHVAYFYGEIRAYLQNKGSVIGQLDIMIAAHALSENATLVTNNTREFKRVKNLKLENWV